MWNSLMRRWLEMATWWLPKEDTSSSEAHAEPAPEPTSPTAAEPPAEPAAGSDDLTAIRGIGPAMHKRLGAMGIHTMADLAAANADDLTERLKADKAVVSHAQVAAWIEAARN
jgi:large subunit ribosomal protein L21